MHLDYQKLVVRSKRRGILRKIVSVLCCLVVFCTTYALILPAISMENHPFCGQEEHLHEEACYQMAPGLRLICGLQEDVPHRHEDSCYVPGEPVEPVIHEHRDACYLPGVPICGMEEDHIHEDSCYEVSLICGLEAGQPEPEEPAEPILICTESTVPLHVHEDACFEETELQPATDCGIWDLDHIHDSDCYVTVCGLEAHSHTPVCFSDPEADVETPEIWEATLVNAVLTGDAAADVVSVAETQIGYMESTRNYDVWEDFSIHGYTRYGAWYGMPYGAWDGMFASFCLQYAGVDMPCHHDAQSWMAALDAAELYANHTETMAQKGNLIFLDSDGSGTTDRVGIVAAVREAQEHTGTDIKVIEGDSADTVRVVHYVPDDAAIVGYGLLPGQERIPVEITEEENPACGQEGHVHDETCAENAEAVYIESSSETVTVTYSAVHIDAPAEEPIEEPAEEPAETPAEEEPISIPFLLYSTLMPIEDGEDGGQTGPTDLKTYVTSHGGSLKLELYNSDDTSPPVNGEGQFEIEQEKTYQLSLRFSVTEGGMKAGIYEYQFPVGFNYTAGQSGVFYDKNTNMELGKWSMDETGKMTFEFYPVSNEYQDVLMTATVNTSVKENVDIIEVDGRIYVVIKQEDEQQTDTTINKFGEMDENSPGKILWTVTMIPGTKEPLVGTIVRDTLESDLHYFSESDKTRGITIGYNDGNGWHQITVNPTWAEDNAGFEFAFPEMTCSNCGRAFQYIPGIEYYITYTTTASETLTDGYYLHKNGIVVGNQTSSGSAGQQIGTPMAYVVKSGEFDLETQDFKWSIEAKIPGHKSGEQVVFWQFQDWARIADLNTSDWTQKDEFPFGPENFEKVTVHVNGQDIVIPPVSQVTPQDLFCYYFYNDILYLASPCHCTPQTDAETCARDMYGQKWCYTLEWEQTDRSTLFCLCWDETEDILVTFDLVYDGDGIIETYRDQDLTFVNSVSLQNFYYAGPDDLRSGAPMSAYDLVPVPGIMKKVLLDQADFNNDFVAAFEITVNDSKLDLSKMGGETGIKDITIVDEMSEFLYYIPGSMIIKQVDLHNQTVYLQHGVDYTMDVSGHIITIKVMNPGPYQYVLDYDAQYISEDVSNMNHKYQNWATVTIAGSSYKTQTEPNNVVDYQYIASSYSVKLNKTCADTGETLSGAVFGLFTENGEKIAQDTTDDAGKIEVKTNLEKNIVFRLHTPYYLQELSAPEGYVLDDTKHWFYFCDKTNGTCEKCIEVPVHDGMVRASDEVILSATNSRGGPILPNTGGEGTRLYLVGGVMLFASAAVLLCSSKKRRKEPHGSP